MLELKNISKIIEDRVILSDISITFPDKGFIGIKGRSGCGKSSLLYILSLLDEDFLGSLFFNDQTIEDVNEYRNNHVSYMMQSNDYIDALTVKENIILSSEVSNIEYSKKKFKDIVKQLGIDHLLNRYPASLSGGQLKRMSIAKAMLKDVDIILCDEPTGNLFEDQAKDIMQLLKDISKSKLVVIVSHDEKLLKDYCDSVLTLENGKLLGSVEKSKHIEYKNKERRKGQVFFYVLQQMKKQRYKYGVFVLFQWVLICVSLLVLSGAAGMLTTIHEMEKSDINKNIIVIENKDYSAFDKLIKGYKNIDYTYDLNLLDCRNEDNESISSTLSFLPENKDHIVLMDGDLPDEKYEVIVNEKLYKSLMNKDIIVSCDDFSCRLTISGYVKDGVFKENRIYLSSLLKEDLELTKDIYSLTIESNNVKEDYEKLQKDYYVYSEVIDMSENYSTLLLYSEIVGCICILMSLCISLLLYSIVSSIVLEQRVHDLCYLKTLGMSNKRLYNLTLVENIVLVFIIVCGGAAFYEVSFFYFNYVFNLENYFYFSLQRLVLFFGKYDIYVLMFLIYLGLCCLCNYRTFKYVNSLNVLEVLRED